MELDFVTPPSPIGPDEIARVELSLGTSLPQAYRTFLELRGGGRPVANRSLSPTADRVGVGVTKFFRAADLAQQRDYWRGRVPDELLPIADAEGGNLVCLLVVGDDSGAVYFWDHEGEQEEGTEPDGSNLTRIASGFSEFVDALTQATASEPDPPVEVRSAWIDPEFLANLETETD